MLPRNDRRVGKNIIVIIGAHRAGIAEIINLDRSRSSGKSCQSADAGEAVKVDDNVDFKLSDKVGDILIAERTGIYKSLKRSLQPPGEFRVLLGTPGNCGDLEARSVMMFEKARHQISDGMFAQVGGNIGDADAVMRIDIAPPQRLKDRLIFDIIAGAQPFLAR